MNDRRLRVVAHFPERRSAKDRRATLCETCPHREAACGFASTETA